jgi:hypothetical protein
VTLKSTDPLSLLQFVELQVSEDGVHFSTLRNVAEYPGAVRTFRFRVTSARYVRLNIRNFLGSEIEVNEFGVYPQWSWRTDTEGNLAAAISKLFFLNHRLEVAVYRSLQRLRILG